MLNFKKLVKLILSTCHILFFNIIFAFLYNKENDFMEKVIDESKQGTNLVIDKKEGNSKKLFRWN